MKLKIELEVEITGDCSFEEAQDFFRHIIADEPMPLGHWDDNPLLNDEYDAEYEITDMEIEEV
jgi:hypothetical protein